MLLKTFFFLAVANRGCAEQMVPQERPAPPGGAASVTRYLLEEFQQWLDGFQELHLLKFLNSFEVKQTRKIILLFTKGK